MPAFLTVDVRSSSQLKAVVLALDGAERSIQAAIRRETKNMAQPEWQKAVTAKAVTPLQVKFLGTTARTKVDNRGVALQAGGLSRTVSGGFSTSDKNGARAVEFGANRQAVTTYTRKGHRVTRHTQRQLSWTAPKGLVVFPAAKPLVGRFVSLWVQTTVYILANAYEGKQVS